MLPGTKYTPESILRILQRRWWIIAGPLVLASAAAYYYGGSLPDTYRSETLLMLMPQRISEGYVRSAINISVEARLTTLKEQVLSRPHLEKLILDLNLYAEERQAGGSMQRLVERIKREVKTEPQGPVSFRVSYMSYSPTVAQQVTERIASLFSEENLRDRENVAEATNSFLDSELAEAKERLLEQEKKVEQYKLQFGQELPGQVGANLQASQSADTRLRALVDAMDRDRGSRQTLERQLGELQAADPLLSAIAREASAPDSATRRRDAARAELVRLEQRLLPDHPDVRAKKREIRDLEIQADAELKAVSVATPKSAVPSADESARQRRIKELTAQISDIDKQLASREEQQRVVRAEIASYERRLSALPTREAEMVEMTRDYETKLESYNRLAKMREESSRTANLERKNVGEQFRVLEPARVPERPFSPDRARIQLVGTAVGLVLGLAIIGFLEYRDSSFKTDEDVFRVLGLPVLAVISVIAAPVETERKQINKKRWTRWLASTSGVVLAGVSVATWLWRQS